MTDRLSQIRERCDKATYHELKTWPQYYKAIVSGEKRFEIRVKDRDFKVGDVLILREYDPDAKAYLGGEYWVRVTYMVSGAWGIPDNIAVMSIKPEVDPLLDRVAELETRNEELETSLDRKPISSRTHSDEAWRVKVAALESKLAAAEELARAVSEYHAAQQAAYRCPQMILSSGKTDEAARLMRELDAAESKMWAALSTFRETNP
jgi:hypothetical protein